MFELLFFGLFLGTAPLPLLALFSRIKVQARLVISGFVILWLGLFTAIFWTAASEPDGNDKRETSVIDRPIQVTTEAYVTSDSCRSCHPHNHSTWHDSYHRTMTQVATPESVIGDFDNVGLTDGDVRVHLRREGDRFLAQTVLNRDNKLTHSTFPIVLTTGSHHMQFYWFSVSESMLGKLPFVYLNEEEKWIPARSSFLSHAISGSDETLPVTFDEGQWNQVCIKCHTTHGRFSPDSIDQAGNYCAPFKTEVVDFGISCEACHGPGQEHIRANRSPLRRYAQHLSSKHTDSTIVNPATLPHDLSSQVCGQCHSIYKAYQNDADPRDKWLGNGFEYRPGEDLTKSRLRFIVSGSLDSIPQSQRERLADDPEHASYVAGSFWPDGMVRVVGREYNGLTETACFQRGEMSCLSCHRMHQLRGDRRPRKDWANDQLDVGMKSNQACTQCHDKFTDDDAVENHTHHLADSSGSSCYNCHMPYTTYGLLKAVRSHEIESPNVKVSQETGRPNACNQCHLDKTLAWTAEHLYDRYRITKPTLSKDEQEIAASVLWILSGDAGQRALTAWSFGWQEARSASSSNWQTPLLAQLLEDPYDAVRFIAYRSLSRMSGFEDFHYDFVGPREERAASHKQALNIWRKRQLPPDKNHKQHVLINERGTMMKTTLERLLKLRDDRPVTLLE